MSGEKLYTSTEVGEILQVTASSVVKWVNGGLLKAYTTPGGHRRIRVPDLLVFLREHGMYVPPEFEPPKRRILFADAEPKVLSAMQRSMKPYAAQVEFHTALSGVDALVMVGSLKPDLLILDLMMPNLDGLEVLTRLKARPETRDIEVVMLTRAPTAALAKKALALGAKAVMSKPVGVAQILELSSVRAAA